MSASPVGQYYIGANKYVQRWILRLIFLYLTVRFPKLSSIFSMCFSPTGLSAGYAMQTESKQRRKNTSSHLCTFLPQIFISDSYHLRCTLGTKQLCLTALAFPFAIHRTLGKLSVR